MTVEVLEGGGGGRGVGLSLGGIEEGGQRLQEIPRGQWGRV